MENNEQELEIYTLTDEEGKEQDFAVLAKQEVDGKTYFAMVPADEDSDVYVILRMDVDENGDGILVTIDDDDEFEKVADLLEDTLFDTVDYDEK